jgi:hypothetical protein
MFETACGVFERRTRIGRMERSLAEKSSKKSVFGREINVVRVRNLAVHDEM